MSNAFAGSMNAARKACSSQGLLSECEDKNNQVPVRSSDLSGENRRKPRFVFWGSYAD